MLKYFNKFLYTVYIYFYCKDTDLNDTVSIATANTNVS